MKIRLHDGYRKFLDALAAGPVILSGFTRYTSVSTNLYQGYRYASITMTMHRELKHGDEPVVRFERKEIEGRAHTFATLTERGKKVLIQGWFESTRK